MYMRYNDAHIVQDVTQLSMVKLKLGDRVIIVDDAITSLVVSEERGDLYLLEGTKLNSDIAHNDSRSYAYHSTSDVIPNLLYLGDDQRRCVDVELTYNGDLYDQVYQYPFWGQLTARPACYVNHLGNNMHYYTVGFKTKHGFQGLSTSLMLTPDTRTWAVSEDFLYGYNGKLYLIKPTTTLTDLWWTTIDPNLRQVYENYKYYLNYLNYLKLLSNQESSLSIAETCSNLELAIPQVTTFLTPLYTEGDVQVYAHNDLTSDGKVLILRSGRELHLTSDDNQLWQQHSRQTRVLLRYLAHYENIDPRTGICRVQLIPIYHDAGGILYAADYGAVIRHNWYFKADNTELKALRQRYALYLALTKEA